MVRIEQKIIANAPPISHIYVFLSWYVNWATYRSSFPLVQDVLTD